MRGKGGLHICISLSPSRFPETLGPAYSLGDVKEVFFLNAYLFFEREGQRASGGGAEREGDTESEAGSGLRAPQHREGGGARTLELRDPDLSRSRKLHRLSRPGAPTGRHLKKVPDSELDPHLTRYTNTMTENKRGALENAARSGQH